MEERQREKKFYSKQELEEFKAIINRKLAAARAEHKNLADSLKAFSGNSVDSFNFTDFGNESREKEQIEILMARQEKFIRSLENALARIENRTYGVCRVTGNLIPKERLRVVPHATTTVEGKRMQKSGRR